jgi:hypothetical protein
MEAPKHSSPQVIAGTPHVHSKRYMLNTMPAQETTYRNRRAVSIEDERLRVTVTVEGGHIAGILDKATGINPLWTPPWPSIEPSTYSLKQHPEYGNDSESKLLSGILGHNLCLDIFGPPSAEEFAAGVTVHGESPVAPYSIESDGARMTTRAHLPIAMLGFERRLELAAPGILRIHETVTNLAGIDRPIAWTQHVTLGPPFLEPGKSRLVLPARRSMVYPHELGPDQRYAPGAKFEWPHAPNKDGSITDLDTFPAFERSAGVTCHAVDDDREQAFFLAWHPDSRLAFGYAWGRQDFPWISLWEENRSRQQPPWNGQTVTRGVEFGLSPFAEGRRNMVERGSLFGVPTYRWLGARQSISIDYVAFAFQSGEMPEELVETLQQRGMVSAGTR